jgi:exopolysaccharide biosynthesis polyprenyl glycosylphosphotransferase
MSTAQGAASAALAGVRRPKAASTRAVVESIDNTPAAFLWLTDITVAVLSFAISYGWLPILQQIGRPGGVLGHWLYSIGVPPSVTTTFVTSPFAELLGVAAVAALAGLLSMDLLGGYRPVLRQSYARLLLAVILGPLGGLATATIVVFALRVDDFSRLFLFLFVALQSAGFAVSRLTLRAYKARKFKAGYYVREVVLVGVASQVRRLAEHFHRNVPGHAYSVIGTLVIPDYAGVAEAAEPLPVPVLGAVDALGDVLIHHPIADVVVAQGSGECPWLSQVIRDCDYFRTTLRIVPEALLSENLRDLRPQHGLDATGLPALVLAPVRTSGYPVFLKRLLDIVVSATLLLLLAPFFAIIAIAIKMTTPGLTVFYPWRVVGYRGRVFVGYKFTTMQADADQQKAKLAHLNEMSGPVFKIKEDPRITRFGRFLRKYSINELPQLWSVLKGDMSLVGPRPAGPHELERYELWHKRKLSIMPGITCLWQVRGRNKISSFDDWVKMDLEYIDNWSLWLDFRILVRTAIVVFRGTGS